MTELKTEGGGAVYIADEVLTTIAGTAALEAEGVAGLAGYFSEAKNKTLRKHVSRGVQVRVSGQKVGLVLAITAKMGTKLHKISADVQSRVKSAIETMTGLTVAEVNVTVSAVVAEEVKE